MKPVLQANIKEGEYKMKYCPYCGAEITNGAVTFCSECGGNLADLSKYTKIKPARHEKRKKVKKSNAKHTPMKETQPDVDDGDYDGYYDDIIPADTSSAVRQGLDKAVIKKIVLLVAIVVVVIGVCVVLMYFL